MYGKNDWVRVQEIMTFLRGHRKISQKPSETNKIRLGGGGFRKNCTLGFKWYFVYILVSELKPEVRTFVCFGGREEVSSEIILFVSLGSRQGTAAKHCQLQLRIVSK